MHNIAFLRKLGFQFLGIPPKGEHDTTRTWFDEDRDVSSF